MSEILSREQLIKLMHELAGSQVIGPRPHRQPAVPQRLKASARDLLNAYRSTVAAAAAQQPISNAAEWLLDNFHVVEEQLAEIQKDLPKGYYQQLPQLAAGPLAGHPRVYALALKIISHSGGTIDDEFLLACVEAYQSVTPLTMGELWAFPTMLRIALVENLGVLTAQLEPQRRARVISDGWADRIITAAGTGLSEVTVVLGELAHRRKTLAATHHARLFQRLRGRGALMEPAIRWLEQEVAGSGVSIEELLRQVNQCEAADQVSISHCIAGFRRLSSLDWLRFFEAASAVETLLRQHPNCCHSQSDSKTRDACRHVIEQVARGARKDELEVTAQALSLAREAEFGSSQDPHASCVAYFLLGAGRRTLEHAVGYRPKIRERFRRALMDYPEVTYLGTIAIAAMGLLVPVLLYIYSLGQPPLIAVLVGLVALAPAVDLAVSVANRWVTLALPPYVVPKLDFSEGVPEECRTLVVVPTLLGSEEQIDELLDRLEVHFLCNQDTHLHFALLTDYVDAAEAERPADVALLHHAAARVLALNERHGTAGHYAHFFLLHRERRWNQRQRCWMGWERKRGKLMELNRLLRGSSDTSYTICIGDQSRLRNVRYVLCLDADTQLPAGTAHRLIGAMAHPLNRPVVCPESRRVIFGYGVMQPRVSISLTSAGRSLFTRIFSGHAGIDPYTTAVSDVYQDLFGEGVFCGKGIYDVDAFQQTLGERIAENSVLSHDLLEGNFARCAQVSDVEVFDDYPNRYDTYAARQHRWARGDWQLVPWLGFHVRLPDGRTERNPLSLIARWKILDNLRRSLAPAALVVMLISAWLWLPGSPWVWTLMVAVNVLFPIYTHIANALMIDPRGVPWTSYFWGTSYDLLVELKQTALSMVFLAEHAVSGLHAMVVSLWRVFVSRCNLLEWTTAADAERRNSGQIAGLWHRMWPASILGLGTLAVVLAVRPGATLPAAVFLVAWGLSPVLAYWVSLPLRELPQRVPEEQLLQLRLYARRTWRFFQEVITERENWLPPDNFQEDREDPVAHRTSPTNVGLLLLSTVTARDLGYVGLVELADRLERTLSTVERLERFRGHLYNWYDTRSALPLAPLYVSTVDSGNLAGHLLAVKQACLELCGQPVFGDRTLAGLRDTLAAVVVLLPVESGWLSTESAALRDALEGDPRSGSEWFLQLQSIRRNAEQLDRAARDGEGVSEVNYPEVRSWITLLLSQVNELQRDLDLLLPWVRLLLIQPLPFGDGKPLVGDLAARPHILAELVAPPHGKPRGLLELSRVMDRAIVDVERRRAAIHQTSRVGAIPPQSIAWLDELLAALERCRDERFGLTQRLQDIATRCERLVEQMDFRFLYDPERELFSIGFDTASARLDQNHYDFLASECRLASFVAIAKGDVPPKHWFRMSRRLSHGKSDRALVSWTGTMFEYMMPLLVMRSYPGTLLSDSLPAVVRKQQRFARRMGVPWGMSESGCAARDQAMNYQYGAFGVPGLGLKPDLFEDIVVAPYATILALSLAPAAAVRNLDTLAREGLLGRCGWYEAIDYTPERLPRGVRKEIIKSWMSHHQGMILVTLGNYLAGNRMPQRFHSEPLVRSAELLLQERNPHEVPTAYPQTERGMQARVQAARALQRQLPGLACEHCTTADTSTPRALVLGNGHYSVLITNAGGGFSNWTPTPQGAADGSPGPADGGRGETLAVTRWHEDVTRDHCGNFIYLREWGTSRIWGATQQPLLEPANDYLVNFSEDKAEFQRSGYGIISRLEIVVAPDDDVEVRRLILTNTTDAEREIEVTSYVEVVLAPRAADDTHPAFSKLFVETEFDQEHSAILASRRPRSAGQFRPWAFHVLAHEGTPPNCWETVEYETDRALFLGRTHTPAYPVALEGTEPLSGSVGPVLDPIFAVRQRVRIPPRATARMAFATGVAYSRDEARLLAARYHDLRVADRAFALAWTNRQIEMRQAGVSHEDAQVAQRLASRIYYLDPYVRAPAELIARNTLGQPGLWPYGISGDLPIVLADIGATEHLDLLRDLLRARDYLRAIGVTFDLVLLNSHPPSYLQPFEQGMQERVRTIGAPLDQPGGVFIRRASQIPEAGRCLLLAAARVVLYGDNGSLAEQLAWRPAYGAARETASGPVNAGAPEEAACHPESPLTFPNGLGGFSPNGSEYVINLNSGEPTPAPWANVIANAGCGFVATESGLGCTWCGNSREHRLTPWSNDPVADPQGEVLYLCDEETGAFWSATPLPVPGGRSYVIRHGAGYTQYEHRSHGLEQVLVAFVPVDDPVKIYRLTMRNLSTKRTRVSATLYVEWVLGVSRALSHPHVVTSVDPETSAFLARNPFAGEFQGRTAFLDVDAPERSVTGDRTEFLGRNGTPDRPLALLRSRLSGKVGAGLDPCGAVRTTVDLQPGAEATLVFTLGEGADLAETRSLVRKYRRSGAATAALCEVRASWQKTLETVQVKTPDRAFDLLLNHWLLYQVLACRVWGRAGFYQSGGAYGFRDQLQDGMALAVARPDLTRRQILLAASRQFTEGDVQHWWHPPGGRGTRTRISDDLLWLPYVTAHYISTSGDMAVLGEPVSWLVGRPLDAGESEYYDLPVASAEQSTLYEHCVRAIEHALTSGPHGLPLMGSGDWNDGMNRVGHQGRGESVWVAWFLCAVLREFLPLCVARGDTERAARFRCEIERLSNAVETHAWDGDWYLRAFFDDGTPLGSASSQECRIDSIPQSWSIISGAGDPDRARRAMRSVEEHLVRERDGLIKLLTPPFDTGATDPGYIKGYVPGVRENGGQYSHAAAWVVLAAALMGDGERAHRWFSLLNPINHGEAPAARDRYKGEPYVLAGDVYGNPPHTGRAGWTWYTGSASWMYRVGLEAILGLRFSADSFQVDPCIPAGWGEFRITYTWGNTRFHIEVRNPDSVQRGVRSVTLDGLPLPNRSVPRQADGRDHSVLVLMGNEFEQTGLSLPEALSEVTVQRQLNREL